MGRGDPVCPRTCPPYDAAIPMSRYFPALLFSVLVGLPSATAETVDVKPDHPEPGIDIEKGRTFWSFQPLKVVKPPDVKDEQWLRTQIDRFILAKLEAKELRPNEEASRRTMIRRITFGLWGLPPEPEEVEKFVNDPAPDAYERLVDRLLAGEHFGERWARHWLDLARFAESNGYAFDQDRPNAYHYRDFVIKALNEDMPYDRFVKLQLAGDQIEPGNSRAHAATGFIAAGPFTSQQTQKERERSRYEQLDDIVGTIGTSMLGITVGCARCHDHKYDPLPIKDYYRLVACFAETGFQDFSHDPNPAKTQADREAHEAAHKPFVEARTKHEKVVLPGRLQGWEATLDKVAAPEKLGPWHHVGYFEADSFKAAYAKEFPPEKEIDLSKTYGERKWVARPEWKDGVVHKTLQGANSANYLFRTIEVEGDRALPISLGRDDAIKVWLNGESVLAKEVSGGVAPDQDKITLNLKKGVNKLLMKIVNGGGESGFYFSTKPNIPKNIADILAIAPDKRDAKQQETVVKWFAPRDPDWVKLNQAEQDHAKKAPKPALINIFAARKGGATYNFGGDTRKVYFLDRGNSNSKQGLASPGFLNVLRKADSPEEKWMITTAAENKTEKLPPRVALANWITDEEDGAGHLLARVIVNRVWQYHLGRGIVRTPSDFGSQGMAPTHPGLLDYLAAELIRHRWHLKPIHRMILTSAVYRQSGVTQEIASKVDPDNQLWWRRGATRLEAEVIRDTLLSVSGMLDKQMFGKGSLDQKYPRRSVYLTVKRSSLIPILQLFDAPDAMQSIGDRGVTTVPPQALAMMNSPFVRQLAEKFAQRVGGENATPESVVEQSYRLALSRPPSAAERQQMVTFITNQMKAYGAGDDRKAFDMAIADYCQLVLCLNEFIFID